MATKRGQRTDVGGNFPVPVEEQEELLQAMEKFWSWFQKQYDYAVQRADLKPDEYALLKIVTENPGAGIGRLAEALDGSEAQTGRRLEKLQGKGW